MAKNARPEIDFNKLELYYDIGGREFWFKLGGVFACVKKPDLKLHLRAMGLRDEEFVQTDHGLLREPDYACYFAQLHRQINYAGPLAGWRCGNGVQLDGTRRILVTEQAAGIWDEIPKRAPEPKWFISFIQEFLAGETRCMNGVMCEQWEHFCYWLGIGLRSLIEGDFRMGQAAIFCGEPESGKSLVQDIITAIFGGREANPFKFMTGEEKFSENMACSEHWRIEDPSTTIDMASRLAFGEAIKECANNERFNIRAMHKAGVSLPLWRRISISINRERIQRIPPLEGDIEGKVNIYDVSFARKSLDEFMVEREPVLELAGKKLVKPRKDFSRSAVKRKIAEEAPLIRRWLLRNFSQAPDEVQNRRYGIIAAHHPVLHAALHELTKEARLMCILDDVFFNEEPPHSSVKLRAIEIEKKLKASDFRSDIDKIFNFQNACGTLLGTTAKKYPERLSSVKIGGYPHWLINPPARNGETNQ